MQSVIVSKNDLLGYRIYQDPDGQRLMVTTYESEFLSREHFEVLESLPEFTLSELVDIVLTTNSVESSVGASLVLSTRGIMSHPQSILHLLSGLEERSAMRESARIVESCIVELSLYDPTNRREVVGKHIEQINEDARFFSEIALRAKAILANIS